MSRVALGERGFALGLVVLALLISGALIGALFWGALVEVWSGRAAGEAAQASLAADAGWEGVLAGWGGLAVDTMGAGWHAVPPMALGTRVTASVRLRRLGGQLFLVESTGQTRHGGEVSARRTVALLVRSDSGGGAARAITVGPWWFGLSPW